MPFSAVWLWSTLFAILHSSLIRFYTVCHSQQCDHGLHYLPLSAVWSKSRSTLLFSGTVRSGSTLFAIFHSSLIRVYTICYSQQSDQGLHCLPFSAVWSGSTLFVMLRSSLIRVYTVVHSQEQSNQGLHCHSQEQSDQGLHCLAFSGAVWLGSTLSLLRNSLISIYNVLLRSSLIRVYTVFFSILRSALSFSGAVLSGSIRFAILRSNLIRIYMVIFRSSLIRVYAVISKEQSAKGLHCLPFSTAVWSESTLFVILSSLIGLHCLAIHLHLLGKSPFFNYYQRSPFQII